MGLKDLFRKKTLLELSIEESTAEQALSQNVIAIQTGINFIANNIANCEFQTVSNGKPIKSDEYYLWNIKPNPKQTKVEFIRKLVDRLFWFNEVLVVELGGWLYVADGFSTNHFALQPDIYSGVQIDNFTLSKTFNENEVIHLKLNNTNMTVLLTGLLTGYKNLLNIAAKKYKVAGGRKGIIEMNIAPQQNAAWKEALDNIFNVQFKNYFEKDNAVVALPEGQKYTEISGEGSKKSTSDVVDIINLKNEVYTEVGRAMNIHPSLLEGKNADMEQAVNYSITYGVKPVVDLIQSGIINARYGSKEFAKENYIHINMSNISYLDPFKHAVNADKLFADGIYNNDEILVRFGDLPRNTEESRTYYYTKNYENDMKGGEESESDSK
ncbi:MAG: phage portal protein [Ruminococcus sp.]|nr:phage portal protein [Candidatus Copronaster equi]